MLVEKSLNAALMDYVNGKKVVVLQCQEDGRMDANLLSDFLEHDANKYLVDVPIVENPNITLDQKEIIRAVHDTQEESEEGEILPPTKSRR